MGWRDEYQVHPAADVFPMMSDDELAKLGEDIKANGQTIPILFWNGDGKGRVLIDGRNRLEAIERIGMDPAEALAETFICKDPVTHIITLNIRRRHLTKQQQADLIVAAVKAGKKLDQVEPVSGKGGRGKKSPIKEKAVAEAKKHDISEATVKRSIAKAEGKTPKRNPYSREFWEWKEKQEAKKLKAKPRGPIAGEPIVIEHDGEDEDETPARELPASMRVRGFLHRAAESAEMALADDLEGVKLTRAMEDAAHAAMTAWAMRWEDISKKRASTLPQDGRSEVPVGFLPPEMGAPMPSARQLKTPPATPQKSTVSGRQNRPPTPRYYNFEKENEVTIKMTDGVVVIVEGSLGGENYKATRALGYLMKVGDGWIAAVGKQRSKPLPLHQAKAAAKDMHRNPGQDQEGDLILALNRAAAAEVDRAALVQERKRWPVDLVGGTRKGTWPLERGDCHAILSVELGAFTAGAGETLQGDNYPLEYYEDGYPKLPACLDRRASPTGEREAA